MPAPTDAVDLLMLGSGWTAQFLVPLLKKENVSFARTTRQGQDGSIEFDFDPAGLDIKPFANLPLAKFIVVVFPLKGNNTSRKLVDFYIKTHLGSAPFFLQLGSSGIWKVSTHLLPHKIYSTAIVSV